MDLMDLLVFFKKKNEKYFQNPRYYAGVIKKRAQELYGNEIRVFLFGSIVKENYTALSDIDVLLVVPDLKPGIHSEEKVFLEQDMESETPFKTILCHPDDYERWFKKHFLDKCIEI